jgi:predicted nucleotidyltransferase component of viral defense system
MLSREELLREAAATRFQPESLEKVHRLIELLEALRSHPFLKTRIVLKGGTALNLFVFDAPRLSVDIDLNYIGAVSLETMQSERPKIEEAIQAVCGRLGIGVKRVPSEHAGGKWRLSYTSALGRPATLELDMNYMLRAPLWPASARTSHRIGSFAAADIPVLDDHELAAGKLAALFGREASRDLFDTHALLGTGTLDAERLRFGFVVYGGINRTDWRTIRIEKVNIDLKEAEQQLLPLLRSDGLPAAREIPAWSRQLVEECRARLSVPLPLRAHEIEFLTRLNDHGEIHPDLLTSDGRLLAILRSHPGLAWKAKNVREYKAKR